MSGWQKAHEYLMLFAGVILLVAQIFESNGQWWIVVVSIFVISSTGYRIISDKNKNTEKTSS